MEGVPMKDFTLAVISNNTGIVAITPQKNGDTDAILAFRQISGKKTQCYLKIVLNICKHI